MKKFALFFVILSAPASLYTMENIKTEQHQEEEFTLYIHSHINDCTPKQVGILVDYNMAYHGNTDSIQFLFWEEFGIIDNSMLIKKLTLEERDRETQKTLKINSQIERVCEEDIIRTIHDIVRYYPKGAYYTQKIIVYISADGKDFYRAYVEKEQKKSDEQK